MKKILIVLILLPALTISQVFVGKTDKEEKIGIFFDIAPDFYVVAEFENAEHFKNYGVNVTNRAIISSDKKYSFGVAMGVYLNDREKIVNKDLKMYIGVSNDFEITEYLALYLPIQFETLGGFNFKPRFGINLHIDVMGRKRNWRKSKKTRIKRRFF